MSSAGSRPGLRVVAAFATIYLVWGSTYLAIRYAIDSFPPLLMMGIRCLVAGVAILSWTRWRGRPFPARREWIAALWIGGLLFLGGYGALSWAETRMASGPAALVVATLPVWMALLERARPGGDRPGALVFGGLALGLAGVGLLVAPTGVVGGERIDVLATVILLFGTLSWAVGSVYGRGARLPDSPFVATGATLVTGGLLLIAVGLAVGEGPRLAAGSITLTSTLALAYLIAFGSILAYSAYVWLLRVSTPARVGTYAFVNPIVAVALGAAVGETALTARVVAAAALTVGAVVLVLARPRRATDRAARRRVRATADGG